MQATYFKFTATEAGSAGPATIQFYYILLDHKVFYLNAICSSSLAPKSQKSPNQLQKLQNISVKVFFKDTKGNNNFRFIPQF